MKPIIKSMWIDSTTIDLDAYSPEDKGYFGFWIEFRIGIDGEIGADDFRLFVCTPKWLEHECTHDQAIWGRHTLIVCAYDLPKIKKEISKCIENCNGDTWEKFTNQISKYTAWEFEGYQP